MNSLIQFMKYSNIRKHIYLQHILASIGQQYKELAIKKDKEIIVRFISYYYYSSFLSYY